MVTLRTTEPQEIETAAEVLGQALGFFHTHSRYDRDQFITVGRLVRPVHVGDNHDSTYDYGSLMHYGATG
ncbi:hypothetical protein TELCIR_07189 [Teladorsagia circumcincta]|uniref:Metalloendopeptidase n=1 Tax=Teladorsagia circumcincta TaxID=45464 RepID=A0A2G9ULA2_TELCI|nr:hypothetical protein TELCIR_07189 [Teladorsagia circumcincta]